jgi:hypothetical protein
VTVLSNLFVIPHFAGALIFLPVLIYFNRFSTPELKRRLLLIFVVTLAALAGLTLAIVLVGNDSSWNTAIFGWINLGAVLGSSIACIKGDKAKLILLSKPSFAALAAMTFVVACVMFLGGFQNLDIACNPVRTIATVTGTGSHGVILYQYNVNGRTYQGAGDPGNPPYPMGNKFKVQYSAAHPYFSSADSPFTIFGQMLVGMAFGGIGAYSITRSKRKDKTVSG